MWRVRARKRPHLPEAVQAVWLDLRLARHSSNGGSVANYSPATESPPPRVSRASFSIRTFPAEGSHPVALTRAHANRISLQFVVAGAGPAQDLAPDPLQPGTGGALPRRSTHHHGKQRVGEESVDGVPQHDAGDLVGHDERDLVAFPVAKVHQ